MTTSGTPAAHLFVAALLAGASSACIAVPFALPPTQLEIGTGYRDSGRGRDAPLDVRAGVSPLGFSKDLVERPVDFAAGYMYQHGHTRTIEGGWLEGGGRLTSGRIGEDLWARASARMQVRLLAANDSTVLGRGAALRLMGEIVGFGGDSFASNGRDGGVIGFGYGEGGIGAWLEAGYADIGGTPIWTTEAGLVVRLPFLAGIAYAWGLKK
jgi:hypothetical protein